MTSVDRTLQIELNNRKLSLEECTHDLLGRTGLDIVAYHDETVTLLHIVIYSQLSVVVLVVLFVEEQGMRLHGSATKLTLRHQTEALALTVGSDDFLLLCRLIGLFKVLQGRCPDYLPAALLFLLRAVHEASIAVQLVHPGREGI